MPFARGWGIHIVTLQIANRMAGSLRNTRLWTLPCCQLSESINHMVSLMVSGSAAPRAQFSRTTCRLVAMAPVPHGERSCRAVTDGMSMRVPLPCMKSSNGSHQFRMVRAARARDLPIRMVRAARARDLPNQMRPFGSRTWPPFRHTALHAARQSRRRSGICTPRLPRSAGRGPR